MLVETKVSKCWVLGDVWQEDSRKGEKSIYGKWPWLAEAGKEGWGGETTGQVTVNVPGGGETPGQSGISAMGMTSRGARNLDLQISARQRRPFSRKKKKSGYKQQKKQLGFREIF